MKKTLSFLLVMILLACNVMLVSCIGKKNNQEDPTTHPDDPNTNTASQELDYSLDNDGNGYSVIGIGSYTDTNLVIPATYNGMPVTTIGDYAFNGCTSLTSVTIPDSVVTIMDGAFSYCTSITSITIGNSVKTIGVEAFNGCELLTSISFGNSLISIDTYAFYNCMSLTDITLPASLTNIGDFAFAFCPLLENIAFNGTTEEWLCVNRGVDWNLDVPATSISCSNGTVEQKTNVDQNTNVE